MTKIYNVALVGHVANGKTTLVRSLTGVNTKRSSSEQKTGRTIKLGYANCILWECTKCRYVWSSGQEGKAEECCGLPMEFKHLISFVDAPGHHSYVHTMVKGATVVDAALLVTDVRVEPMQAQTIEHLAILSILGVNNIIVLQNKADLSNAETCTKHYEQLKEDLKGTTAENSPIIPISAQNNINLDVLRRTLLDLIDLIDGKNSKEIKDLKETKDSKEIKDSKETKDLQTQIKGEVKDSKETRDVKDSKEIKEIPQSSGAFQIIRSFDVNKPGTRVRDLKGGVIGGSCLGDSTFKIGDIVEIKPGFIKKDKSYVTIETQIVSILAENTKYDKTTPGGLYGLGTKLDPTLTKDDYLSGSLLGIKGQLPDVQTEINMKITSINLDRGERKVRIKPKEVYRMIIGNTVVDAEAYETDKPKVFLMKLSKPICTLETRCLIYNIDSSNTRLIAFGSFGKETAKLPKFNIEQPKYENLTQNITYNEKTKTKIPVIKISRENRNIIWINIMQVSESIYRRADQVAEHIKSETCLNVAMSAGGLRMYKTNINVVKLESIMKKYIKNTVMCKQCNSLHTDADVCLDCHAAVNRPA